MDIEGKVCQGKGVSGANTLGWELGWLLLTITFMGKHQSLLNMFLAASPEYLAPPECMFKIVFPLDGLKIQN